ncbi:hypothetical protein GF336_00465 [Candidatus Woesearchaeota archaeon]|nr:hypothetical protein [Candidatus Woesearchaeota archaeon]
MDKKYEIPISVRIDELGKEHLDYFLTRPFGERRNMPALFEGGKKIDPGTIDKIKKYAAKAGETYVYIKKKQETVTPEPEEIASPKTRQLVFTNIEKTYKAVKEEFSKHENIAEILENTGEKAQEKLREIGKLFDTGIRDSLESMLNEIISNKDSMTMFACLDRYDDHTSDHSLSTFMPGVHLLSKYYLLGNNPSYNKEKIVRDNGFGLLFHDTGKIFVPQEILNKSKRFNDKEMEEIETNIKRAGIDKEYLKIIKIVNDPRRFNNFSEERSKTLKRIIDEKMSILVDKRALTKEQYRSLKMYPGFGCLSPYERSIIEKHSLWGRNLIDTVPKRPTRALGIIRNHHERINGTGYPEGTKKVSIDAQIAGIVDVFDAITSERPYKEARSYDTAFSILKKMSTGKDPEFDNKVYNLLNKCIQRFPRGSLVEVRGGKYDNYIGMVTRPGLTNKDGKMPEFALFKDSKGNRIEKPIMVTRKNYNNSFDIKGLPFTKKHLQEYTK